MNPSDWFASAKDDRLDAVATEPSPRVAPIDPNLSPWDRFQNGRELAFNQSDCNWFAFEAATIDAKRRFAGIVALHRSGKRFTGIEPGYGSGLLGRLLPIRPAFDRRPLFLAVLYELGADVTRPEQIERGVEGEFDPETFSFASKDGHWQWLQARAAEWRPSLPKGLQRFFSADTPAFAVRVSRRQLEVELFLRPVKNPVTYGRAGSPELPGEGIGINYVQRTRLELVGTVRHGTSPPAIVLGDATQDRHWMTTTRLGVRWIWLMARLDDGRELLAYEMRTGDGGRTAPANSGRRIGGGAWVVDRDGEVRPYERWSIEPSHHVTTSRGLVPTRFALKMGDDIHLVLEHEQRAFIPTRALTELCEGGIWESPARLIDAKGVSGGRFWADVMGPNGSI